MWYFGFSMGPNVPRRAGKRKTIFQTSAASVGLLLDDCPQQIKVAPWCPGMTYDGFVSLSILHGHVQLRKKSTFS